MALHKVERDFRQPVGVESHAREARTRDIGEKVRRKGPCNDTYSHRCINKHRQREHRQEIGWIDT